LNALWTVALSTTDRAKASCVATTTDRLRKARVISFELPAASSEAPNYDGKGDNDVCD
jgi:hypothetical protein